ncbi:hypothetical protein [Bordetella sp. BOR01]|uniref:hypothetical protein n=1 Tax=Bordetella sp. BOR01 TaxID=2854779 RepID=UPI001C47342A|nr:hypothetical protein [Bordetella sp. BOR01]MBV7484729.1 hypothetical protein [Bordetella sp. BOR01]
MPTRCHSPADSAQGAMGRGLRGRPGGAASGPAPHADALSMLVHMHGIGALMREAGAPA